MFLFTPIDLSVIAVNPHCSVIVRDGEGKNLQAEVLLALCKSDQIHDTTNCKRHAVSIVAVGGVECRCATLHFACQVWVVPVVGGYEVGNAKHPTDDMLHLLSWS